MFARGSYLQKVQPHQVDDIPGREKRGQGSRCLDGQVRQLLSGAQRVQSGVCYMAAPQVVLEKCYVAKIT